MTIGKYLTPENVRLGLSGVAAAVAVGLLWRAAGRVRWGGIPFGLAAVVAARWNGRGDWFGWSVGVSAGLILTGLAGLGAFRLLADPAVHWEWVAAGSLVSAAGVYAGVPETGPAVVVGGVLVGLTAACAACGARWGPAAGLGVAAVLGWAALSGAAGRPWAAIGGTLCTGAAPGFAIVPLSWSKGRRVPAKPHWVLGAHVVFVALASRWIGVVPEAGWLRVAVVLTASCGTVLAVQLRALRS